MLEEEEEEEEVAGLCARLSLRLNDMFLLLCVKHGGDSGESANNSYGSFCWSVCDVGLEEGCWDVALGLILVLWAMTVGCVSMPGCGDEGSTSCSSWSAVSCCNESSFSVSASVLLSM